MRTIIIKITPADQLQHIEDKTGFVAYCPIMDKYWYKGATHKQTIDGFKEKYKDEPFNWEFHHDIPQWRLIKELKREMIDEELERRAIDEELERRAMNVKWWDEMAGISE